MIRVRRFLVIGGGEAGAFYLRQLRRAVAAGRLETGRIVVIDRDPACRVATDAAHDPLVSLETADWSEWLAAHLGAADPEDHVVPYHWAPHLLLGWLEGELRRAGARVSRDGTMAPRGLPFEATTASGDRALSYASWACPPACIEPAVCPHTRQARDWSLAGDLARDAGGALPIVFRCLHLVYGVGTIPVRDILAARDRLCSDRVPTPSRFVVATSSHCHALATRLEVAPSQSVAGDSSSWRLRAAT